MRELGLLLGAFFWIYILLLMFRISWSVGIQGKSLYKVAKAVDKDGLLYSEKDTRDD